MTKDGSAIRFENAKLRVASNAAFAWRFHDDSGEGLPVDQLRDDFDEVTGEVKTLSELWGFLSQPLKLRVIEMFENPAVDVIDSDGTSWSSVALEVIRRLDSGEKMAFAKPLPTYSAPKKGRRPKRS